MNALQKPMDLDQFIAWENKQEFKHEFDGVQIFAMTGGTGAHSAIEAGLMRALGNHLLDKPCRLYSSNLKIKMAHSVRYPDATVVCTPVAPLVTSTTEPVVVFEILSKSTARVDLGAKSSEYQQVASLQRYIVLRQDRRAAQVFYRTPDGWEMDWADGDSILDMPEIGISIPLAEIYRGITLESDLTA